MTLIEATNLNFPALPYSNVGYIAGDTVIVNFETISGMGVISTLPITGTYTNTNTIVFSSGLTAAQADTLKVGQYNITVSKAGVVNPKLIRVEVTNKNKTGSCIKRHFEPAQDLVCDNGLLIDAGQGAVPLNINGKLSFLSLDKTIDLEILDQGDGNAKLNIELAALKPLVIPVNAPAFVDGATPTVKLAVEVLQSQINSMDKRPEKKGVLPVGGSIDSKGKLAAGQLPTAITAASMPLSINNQDFYVAPSTGFYTLPNGTTAKLDSGEAVVFDKNSNSYYTSRGLDNQLAADVPYSNTASGLASVEVQGAIDELAGISAVKMNKTQGTVAGDKVLLSVGATGIENVESTITKAILEGALAGYDVASGSIESRLDVLTAMGDDQKANEVLLSAPIAGMTATQTQQALEELSLREIKNITVSTLDVSQKRTIQLVAGKDRFFVDYLGVAQRLHPITKQDISAPFKPSESINGLMATGTGSPDVFFELNQAQRVRFDVKTTLGHIAGSTELESGISIYKVTPANAFVSLVSQPNGGVSLPNTNFGDDNRVFSASGSTPLNQTTFVDLPAGRYGAKFDLKWLSGNTISVGDQSYIMVTYLDY